MHRLIGRVMFRGRWLIVQRTRSGLPTSLWHRNIPFRLLTGEKRHSTLRLRSLLAAAQRSQPRQSAAPFGKVKHDAL
jgi:hypothetical protein